MITHSKPFSTPTNLKRIRSTIAEKSYVSDSYSADVKTKCMARFGLTNLYFTSSGAHALYWIIKGLGLGTEDEVIIPTYSCYSICKAIIAAGAQPVLCDVGESTWLMSADTVERKLSKKTKAIVVVHYAGVPCEIDKIKIINSYIRKVYLLPINNDNFYHLSNPQQVLFYTYQYMSPQF
mgnify:CR=1 FL=1